MKNIPALIKEITKFLDQIPSLNNGKVYDLHFVVMKSNDKYNITYHCLNIKGEPRYNPEGTITICYDEDHGA